jgi:hypothetical protein
MPLVTVKNGAESSQRSEEQRSIHLFCQQLNLLKLGPVQYHKCRLGKRVCLWSYCNSEDNIRMVNNIEIAYKMPSTLINLCFASSQYIIIVNARTGTAAFLKAFYTASETPPPPSTAGSFKHFRKK